MTLHAYSEAGAARKPGAQWFDANRSETETPISQGARRRPDETYSRTLAWLFLVLLPPFPRAILPPPRRLTANDD
jgi:hypothetical protein